MADPSDASVTPIQVDILTLFPEVFANVLEESILGRARRSGLYEVHLTNIRDFTTDRHRTVDDRPYGGGPGMVFKPEPVYDAVESVLEQKRAPEESLRKVILSPRGPTLRQRTLRDWAARAEWIILLCGHYEGFDERIFDGLGFEPLSIGDFVLSGGEIAAMVVLDGLVRLIPSALGHPESNRYESFEEGLLDHPQYTRPPVFRDMKVPEVLMSGDHGEIAKWRREQALKRTQELRADLLDSDGSDDNDAPAEEDIS
ncbi:MAG: tRNA (guanosine(37)-N1)-methyltransferase TrmD [Planctomycetota bacterium]